MGTRGMENPAPYSDTKLYNDYYTYNYHVPTDLVTTLNVDVKKPDASIKLLAGKDLTFKTVQEGITLKPLYDIHRQRYVVYWNLK